jgi:hypothetical protein
LRSAILSTMRRRSGVICSLIGNLRLMDYDRQSLQTVPRPPMPLPCREGSENVDCTKPLRGRAAAARSLLMNGAKPLRGCPSGPLSRLARNDRRIGRSSRSKSDHERTCRPVTDLARRLYWPPHLFQNGLCALAPTESSSSRRECRGPSSRMR